MTSIDACEVLEHERGHQVALLGVLALQAGDDAADACASRRRRRSRELGDACSRRAAQRAPRRPSAGGRSRRARASPSRTRAAAPCRTRASGIGDAGSSNTGSTSRRRRRSSNRLIMPSVALAAAARACASMICSNTSSRPLRGWPSESNAAGLDQRLDRALVEHRSGRRARRSRRSRRTGRRRRARLDELGDHALADVAHRRQPEADRVGPARRRRRRAAHGEVASPTRLTSGTSTSMPSCRHSLR